MDDRLASLLLIKAQKKSTKRCSFSYIKGSLSYLCVQSEPEKVSVRYFAAVEASERFFALTVDVQMPV